MRRLLYIVAAMVSAMILDISCEKEDGSFGFSVKNGLDTCWVSFSGLDEFVSVQLYLNDTLYDSKAVMSDSADFEILNYNLSPGVKNVSAHLMWSKDSYDEVDVATYTVYDVLYGQVAVTMEVPAFVSELCDITLFYTDENAWARYHVEDIDGDMINTPLKGWSSRVVQMSGENGRTVSEQIDYTLAPYDTTSFQAFFRITPNRDAVLSADYPLSYDDEELSFKVVVRPLEGSDGKLKIGGSSIETAVYLYEWMRYCSLSFDDEENAWHAINFIDKNFFGVKTGIAEGHYWDKVSVFTGETYGTRI